LKLEIPNTNKGKEIPDWLKNGTAAAVLSGILVLEKISKHPSSENSGH
jgi:hypothetical protein